MDFFAFFIALMARIIAVIGNFWFINSTYSKFIVLEMHYLGQFWIEANFKSFQGSKSFKYVLEIAEKDISIKIDHVVLNFRSKYIFAAQVKNIRCRPYDGVPLRFPCYVYLVFELWIYIWISLFAILESRNLLSVNHFNPQIIEILLTTIRFLTAVNGLQTTSIGEKGLNTTVIAVLLGELNWKIS